MWPRCTSIFISPSRETDLNSNRYPITLAGYMNLTTGITRRKIPYDNGTFEDSTEDRSHHVHTVVGEKQTPRHWSTIIIDILA